MANKLEAEATKAFLQDFGLATTHRGRQGSELLRVRIKMFMRLLPVNLIMHLDKVFLAECFSCVLGKAWMIQSVKFFNMS